MSANHGETDLPALNSLGAQFSGLERNAAGHRRRGPNFGWLKATAIAAVLLAVFLAATPPGRSVAEAVGDLVGIGDEAPAESGEKAVYIGVGDTKERFPYEVVAATNGAKSGNPETCFAVRFPDAKALFSVDNCLTGESSRRRLEDQGAILTTYSAPASFGPDAGLVVQGPLSSSVVDVSVAYETPNGGITEVATYISALDAGLSEQIGAQDEARFVVSLLPVSILEEVLDGSTMLTEGCLKKALGHVKVTTFAEDGETVSQLNLGEGGNYALLTLPPPGFTSVGGVPLPGEKSSPDPAEAPVPYEPQSAEDCA